MSEVEHILASQNLLGEGPLWSVDEQVLYWVDIESNNFWRLNPNTGVHETINVGSPIGVMALRASGGLVMAVKEGFAYWDAHAQQLEYIVKLDPQQHQTRFNDGAVDSAGRFWAGTMSGGPGKEGALYRLDPDGSLHTMITGISIPNGIGWSPDDKTMYFTDTDAATMFAYDFDAVTGEISNRRVFVQVPEEVGYPDGMTVDSEGYIWGACWDGAKLVRYAPDGSTDRVIPVPALRPTSCVFGGPDLSELYITSAGTGMSEQQKQDYPLSGDLFRLKTGIKGREKHKFAG